MKARKSILITLPDPPGRPVSTAILETLQTSLRAADPGIGISVDYISQFNKDRPGFMAAQLEWYRNKYYGIQFDVIVTVGPNGLASMLPVRNELWPTVPIVFCGIDADVYRRYATEPNMTGRAYSFTSPVNVQVIAKVLPDVQRLALIGGASPTDRFFHDRLRRHLREAGIRYEIIDLTRLDLDELKRRVAALPPHTAIVLDSYLYDNAGNPVYERDLLIQLRPHIAAPLFATNGLDFGFGTVGGVVSQLDPISKDAASVIQRVLSGEPVASIPVEVTQALTLQFDWRELQQWNIPLKLLPPGSQIFFRPESIWQRYGWWLPGILAAGLLEALLIAVLLYERRRRRINETARRMAELETSVTREELSHLNRVASLGEMASSLAHELNQPLAGILSNAQAASQFLKHTPPNLEEVTAALEDIRDDDLRAGEVIRRMRKMLKKGEVQSVPLDLNTVAADAVTLMRIDAQLRGIAVELELTPDTTMVRGDSVQLQQVIMNLILNAMEAMKPSEKSGNRIVVRTYPAGAQHGPGISVTDSGAGIPAGAFERIFQPFFSTKQEGLGMGLSISRSLVEAHGGRIWGTNEESGGATFHVVLRPAAAAVESAAD